MLIFINYNKGEINAAIKRALEIDRTEALKEVAKKHIGRVICVITFNPKIPTVSSILHEHWKTMTKDTKLLKGSLNHKT